MRKVEVLQDVLSGNNTSKVKRNNDKMTSSKPAPYRGFLYFLCIHFYCRITLCVFLSGEISDSKELILYVSGLVLLKCMFQFVPLYYCWFSGYRKYQCPYLDHQWNCKTRPEILFYFVLFHLFIYWPCLRDAEFPGSGIKPEPQQ